MTSMIFLQLIQHNPEVYRFDAPNRCRFIKDLTDNKVRLEFVVDLVRELIA